MPRGIPSEKNLVQKGRQGRQQTLQPLEQNMQQRSKVSFRDDTRVPTHVPYIRRYRAESGSRPTGTVRRYKAIRPREPASHTGYRCKPMAFEEGTTAPEMMLFPYIRDPDTGSRMPSMSTGGAAMKAIIKQVVAANRHGIMSTPNQPT